MTAFPTHYPDFPYPELKIEETDCIDCIQTKINKAVVIAINELASNYIEKLKATAVKAEITAEELSEKRKWLLKGPWLRDHFYQRCIELGETELLNNFRNKDYLFKGYMDPSQFELYKTSDSPFNCREVSCCFFYFVAKEGKEISMSLQWRSHINFLLLVI